MQEQKDAIGCASTGEPREGHSVVALAGSLRDNTATPATATSFLEHSGDSMSFMQLTQEQTAAIRWARVEQAVQRKQSIYDVFCQTKFRQKRHAPEVDSRHEPRPCG